MVKQLKWTHASISIFIEGSELNLNVFHMFCWSQLELYQFSEYLDFGSQEESCSWNHCQSSTSAVGCSSHLSRIAFQISKQKISFNTKTQKCVLSYFPFFFIFKEIDKQKLGLSYCMLWFILQHACCSAYFLSHWKEHLSSACFRSLFLFSTYITPWIAMPAVPHVCIMLSSRVSQ